MHNRFTSPARRWRSLTPLALPESAARRRIGPARARVEGKSALERATEEARARLAVATAVRQSGVVASVRDVQVQREPFQRHGSRAEQFAPGTRFAKERLWHAQIVLATPVAGPLVLGDGRFLGLGLMEPLAESDGVFAFHIGAAIPEHATDPLVRAMRRAVLARTQAQHGEARLPTYFTGHAEDGTAARSADTNHIAVHWDAPRQRLLVLAPHRLDRRTANAAEIRELGCLDAGLAEMSELIAGRAGRHELTPLAVALDDPCFVTAHLGVDLRLLGDALREASLGGGCDRHRLPGRVRSPHPATADRDGAVVARDSVPWTHRSSSTRVRHRRPRTARTRPHAPPWRRPVRSRTLRQPRSGQPSPGQPCRGQPRPTRRRWTARTATSC
jgi:hypothetical protein